MKKLLLVLAIGSFVACNDGGNADAEGKTDSAATPATVDTATAPAPTVDSAAAPAATDSAAKKVDSAAKKK